MEKKLIKKIGLHLIGIEMVVLAGVAGIGYRFVPRSIYDSMEQRLVLERKIFYESNEVEWIDRESVPHKLVAHIPTVKNEAMFAVDALTGAVLDESLENEPWLELEAIGAQEKVLEAIQESGDGCMVWIQKRPVFLKSKVIYDNILLVEMYWPVLRLEAAVIMTLGSILMSVFIMISSVFVIRRYFKRYIFDDMVKIEEGISRVISGEPDVVFETKNDTEVKSIIRALNAWNRNMQSTAKRLDWAVTATNTNSAMFQCLSYADGFHHSDNLQKILGLDDESWERLKNDNAGFLEYIGRLLREQNEEGLVKTNEKYLQISLMEQEGDFFGIITDRTEEKQTKRELKKVQEEAIRDGLTGMLNRKGFEQYLRVLLSEKNNDTIVMVMFDVDNFKKLNDTKGHPVGDLLLQQISRLIKKSFRKNDMVARLGGDEFAMLLNSPISQEVLESKLEKLLAEVREELKEYDCRLSLSIGAVYMKAESVSYEELYQRTDEALYEAKKSGKNTYAVHRYE